MSLEGSLRRDVPNAAHIYRPDILRDLVLGDSNDDTAEAIYQRNEDQDASVAALSVQGHESTAMQTTADRATAKREYRREEERLKDETFRLLLEKRKADELARQEAEFQSRYHDVLSGMEGEGIMGEAQYALDHSQRIKGGKKKGLYDEWSTEVFDKIQGRVQHKVDTMDIRQLEGRLNSQMNEFLHTTNNKLGVFLDTIDKDDYDPMKVVEGAVKVSTGDIRDPLKRDVLKPLYEQQLMEKLSGRSPTTSPRKLPITGKDTLDTRTWGEHQITSTPYGHCIDKSGNYIIRPLSAKLVAQRKSHIVMDHYGYPNKDNAVADAEQGKRGKGSVPPPGAAGAAMTRGLFSLVQQHHLHSKSAPNSPGDGGVAVTGDLWLDAKGKAKMAGPEETRGRKDLKSTLQQQGPDPYRNPEAGRGDWWIEAKGKGHPPGPEMRRGRANLSETLQQLSNPYKDGRTLGDLWLETKGKKSLAPKYELSMKDIVSSMEGRPDPPPKPRGAGGAARNKSHLVPSGGLLSTIGGEDKGSKGTASSFQGFQ